MSESTTAALAIAGDLDTQQSERDPPYSQWVVGLLVVLAAAGGAVSGVHPTGTGIIDPIYGAAFAAAVTWVCSRAGRESWLVLAVVAAALSRGWLLLPGFAGLGLAFSSIFDRRSRRLIRALVGAVEAQVVLRWGPVAFHGLTAALAAVAIAPVVVSAYRGCGSLARARIRRGLFVAGGVALVLSLPIAIAALLVASKISSGEHETLVALDDVSNGSASTATSDLRHARANFESASSALGAWWTSGASLVPLVSQQRRALAVAGSTAASLLSVAAREAPRVDYHALDYHDGQVDLSKFGPMLAPAKAVAGALSVAQVQLRSGHSQWLLSPIAGRIRKMHADLSRATSSTQLAVQAIPLLPDMLGADGPRHYFLAFTTPAEARGLGGFVGAYGELTASGGHLALTVSGSTDDLAKSGIPPSERQLTGLPDFMAQYGPFLPQQFIQDATFSPDFPTVADVISQLYPQAGGSDLDGVLAVDPYGLAALLKITGPVQVSGLPVPLTAQNAARLLLLDQYTIYDSGQSNNVARHDFLQDVLHLAFDRLVHGSLPSPRTLATYLSPAVRQGRIFFWSGHPAEQRLVTRLRLDGSFPSADGGDLLAFTVQNAAATKIDALLHQTTSDRITFNPSSGAIADTVTISLRNDAPSSGLPNIVIGEEDAAPGTPPGSNYAMVTLYSPLRLYRATLNGADLNLSPGRELGVNTYRTWITIPPLSTYTFEARLGGRLPTRGVLPAVARLQPEANPQAVSIEVSPTTGWVLAPDSPGQWRTGSDLVARHVFVFRNS